MITIKTVGIICEYNPFHNGHKYHIEQAKKITGADAAVCIMSGNFVQRGEAAVCDKFSRSKAAVLGGADLVLELPVVYSLSCAEKFASGAVEILDKIGADYLCFGAECGDIKKLERLCDILLNETEEFKKALKDGLNQKKSYQQSRDAAIKSVCGVSAAPLSKPNNALAIEYLKAIKRLNSKIKPVLIKRLGADYNDKAMCDFSFSSARAIRENLKTQNAEKILKAALPPETLFLYENEITAGRFALFSSGLDSIILYRLRTIGADELKNINDVSEGIENRIINGAKICSSFSELINYVSGKRYTKSRIARIILCAVLNIKKTDVTAPEYVRVLAANDAGAKVLKQIKKTCPLPVITKITNKTRDLPMLKFDIAASDIYSLLFKDDRSARRDFKISPSFTENQKNYVYILRCADSTLYTGWTNNLEKRLADHDAKKGAKYTKTRTPVTLEYFEIFAEKSKALSREYEIKQLSKQKKESLIKNFKLKK